MVFSKKIAELFVLLCLSYAASKLLYNPDGSVNGGFSANLFLLLNGMFTLMLLGGVFLQKKNLVTLPKSKYALLIVSYYLLALFSVSYSSLSVLSLYQSLVGLVFCLAGVVISEAIIVHYRDSKMQIYVFVRLLFWFSVFAMSINAIYFVIVGRLTFSNFFVAGIPSDFLVVTFLIVAAYELSRRAVFGWMFFFSLLGVYLGKSFSSMLAFSIALVILLLINRKYLAFSIISAVFLGLFSYVVSVLNSGIGQLVVNGKTAEAYLSGSGRFSVYEACWDVYINEFNIVEQLIGRGFMAERASLNGRGLTWTIDAHSTFFVNLIGLGALGVFFLLVFWALPILKFSGSVVSSKLEGTKYNTFLLFHITSLLFGLTSSHYLARPSYLITFGVAWMWLLESQMRRINIRGQS